MSVSEKHEVISVPGAGGQGPVMAEEVGRGQGRRDLQGPRRSLHFTPRLMGSH